MHHSSGISADLPTETKPLLLAPEFINRKPIFSLRHAITDHPGSGILTRCPSTTPFGLVLGPTNPTMIAMGSETLGVRRPAFSAG